MRVIKRTVSSEPTSEKVYRIPTRKEYRQRTTPGDITWEELYGKKRCSVCGEHFEEGDEYIAEASVKKRKRWVMNCRHATCDPANPPKRTRKRKAVVEEEDDDTKKIYTDVEEKIGETLLLHGKVMTIIDKDSDDEGDYIVVEELEDDDDEGDEDE